LGFDDGEGGQRTSTEFVVHLSSSFEKSGVKIENVTRVGFSTGGSSQQKRHLSVSDGLLGKIVVDNEAMFAAVSEIFTDGATRVGSQELKGSSFGSSSSNDDGVFQGAVVSKNLNEVGDSRSLLSDSNVDAVKLLLGVSGIEVSFLVKDSIDGDSGLTGLSITNNEFSLSSTDGDLKSLI
jgi:hypothetical protein